MNSEKINSNDIISYPPIKVTDNLLERKWTMNFDIVPVVNDEDLLVGFISKDRMMNTTFDQYVKMFNRFKQVLNSTYNGIIAIDSEGNIIVYNPAAERILGIKRAEVVGRHISYMDPKMGLLETLYNEESAIGVKKKYGDRVILSNRTPLIYEGKCIGAVGVFVDISDLERVSHKLDAHKKLVQDFNGIFESSYDGLYICDKDGRVTKVNSSWEMISGFKREFVIGKTPDELMQMGLYDNSAASLALKKKKTTSTMIEITAGPKQGQIIMATATPIFDDNKELSQVVVNVRDITDLENLKSQLQETEELTKRYASELEEIRLQQHQKLEDYIANSPTMKKVIELAIRVSRVDSTVIITGESGVGKGVLAEKIHLLSERKGNSLITINCGAIPEHLLESELFGYEGGAFTGAKREGKAGMFELASGGTLFLDEIGDLPLSLQVKLLRVLQQKEIVRVGGVKPIKVDTRIIAATNKDLDKMVKEGKFREDLYYRLNVINIWIPPLRERKEDLFQLICTIMNSLNKKYHENKKVSQPVIDRLLSYDWPGNIRELENTLERLVVLSYGKNISIEDLPGYIQGNNVNTDIITLNNIVPLKQAVEEVESQLLTLALKKYKTTRKVASALGVNQSTIVRKIKNYNLGNADAI
ncbi:sigma 54-interacting transcriptional regulator [Wukongibacter baidiensis]